MEALAIIILMSKKNKLELFFYKEMLFPILLNIFSANAFVLNQINRGDR